MAFEYIPFKPYSIKSHQSKDTFNCKNTIILCTTKKEKYCQLNNNTPSTLNYFQIEEMLNLKEYEVIKYRFNTS